MMLRLMSCFGLALALATGSLQAQESSTCECPVTAGMEKLPQMTFKVGAEETCCMHSAESLAKKSDEPVHFVVAKAEFDDKAKAMEALAVETERFVNDFAQPKTCGVSGTTTVAGHTLSCSEKAAKLASTIESAMQTVAMTYQVGDESCNCPMQAKTMADKMGEPTKFVVGEETTCCSVEARINLARAKYKAALEAMSNLPADEQPEA